MSYQSSSFGNAYAADVGNSLKQTDLIAVIAIPLLFCYTAHRIFWDIVFSEQRDQTDAEDSNSTQEAE